MTTRQISSRWFFCLQDFNRTSGVSWSICYGLTVFPMGCEVRQGFLQMQLDSMWAVSGDIKAWKNSSALHSCSRTFCWVETAIECVMLPWRTMIVKKHSSEWHDVIKQTNYLQRPPTKILLKNHFMDLLVQIAVQECHRFGSLAGSFVIF